MFTIILAENLSDTVKTYEHIRADRCGAIGTNRRIKLTAFMAGACCNRGIRRAAVVVFAERALGQ